jgi:hypothetical protein
MFEMLFSVTKFSRILHKRTLCIHFLVYIYNKLILFEIAITHNATHVPTKAANIIQIYTPHHFNNLQSTDTMSLHGPNRTSRYETFLFIRYSYQVTSYDNIKTTFVVIPADI